MFKLKNILLIVFIFSCPVFAWSVKILFDNDLRDYYILDAQISHTGTDAAIRKISNGFEVYILKQIHGPSLDEQFLLINDVIAYDRN